MAGGKVFGSGAYFLTWINSPSAYLTFVALDTRGKPHPVPPLFFENEEEVRRNREAQVRREFRLAEKKREAACQRDGQRCPL
jgi:acyl-CoA hydrolase